MKGWALWVFAANRRSGTHGTAPGAGRGLGSNSCSNTGCAVCLERGFVEPATICDHVEPHHGDVNKFWLGPFMSLCKRCHDSGKRFAEIRGFRSDVGLAPSG